MIVMVGECTGRRVAGLEQLGWGRMWIARGRNIYTYPGEPWGLDNGAYRDWTAGVSFRADLFRASLVKARQHPKPTLAVCPDIVGSADSLGFSLKWRDHLPDDMPWFLAVQDGMTPKDVTPHMGRFDGVFLGGTSAYKATAGQWSNFAHDHGKWFHYGRCGTIGKLEHAYEVGADSCDSALLMWTDARWKNYAHHWLHKPQTKLAL